MPVSNVGLKSNFGGTARRSIDSQVRACIPVFPADAHVRSCVLKAWPGGIGDEVAVDGVDCEGRE